MYIPCKNCGQHFETWTTLAKDSSFCTPFCESQGMLFSPNKEQRKHAADGGNSLSAESRAYCERRFQDLSVSRADAWQIGEALGWLWEAAKEQPRKHAASVSAQESREVA
jgi:hypothetical protein